MALTVFCALHLAAVGFWIGGGGWRRLSRDQRKRKCSRSIPACGLSMPRCGNQMFVVLVVWVKGMPASGADIWLFCAEILPRT